MPSTHTSLNIHAVFSTKERRPLIKGSFREDLYRYVGGVLRNKEAVLLEIGGIEDHVHVLFGIRSTHRIDEILRDIKAGSSGWLRKEKGQPFAWQNGYGAFSVSPDRVPLVQRYIRGQEEHHRKHDFQNEYVKILDSSGVSYNPEYLW